MFHLKPMPLLILAACLALPLASLAEDIPAPADVAAPPAEALVTDSGLASRVITW